MATGVNRLRGPSPRAPTHGGRDPLNDQDARILPRCAKGIVCPPIAAVTVRQRPSPFPQSPASGHDEHDVDHVIATDTDMESPTQESNGPKGSPATSTTGPRPLRTSGDLRSSRASGSGVPPVRERSFCVPPRAPAASAICCVVQAARGCAWRGSASSLPVPVGAPLRESVPGGVYGTPHQRVPPDLGRSRSGFVLRDQFCLP